MEIHQILSIQDPLFLVIFLTIVFEGSTFLQESATKTRTENCIHQAAVSKLVGKEALHSLSSWPDGIWSPSLRPPPGRTLQDSVNKKPLKKPGGFVALSTPTAFYTKRPLRIILCLRLKRYHPSSSYMSISDDRWRDLQTADSVDSSDSEFLH